MYDLSYFKEPEHAVVLQFMQEHPFAFLTGSFADGRQAATQVPVMLISQEDRLVIQGHIMRKTDHHKAFMENPNALLVFTGPSTYVSASWYTNPQIGSTWNYMSVHAQGKIRFMDDDELIDLMKRLTLHFEKGNPSSPTIYDNLPDTFLEHMMPAIVGFEMKVDALENVFKLSQNRDEESYDNIITRLEEQGGDAAYIANEMRKRRTRLFPDTSS